jgi:hypothetical protein
VQHGMPLATVGGSTFHRLRGSGAVAIQGDGAPGRRGGAAMSGNPKRIRRIP